MCQKYGCITKHCPTKWDEPFQELCEGTVPEPGRDGREFAQQLSSCPRPVPTFSPKGQWLNIKSYVSASQVHYNCNNVRGWKKLIFTPLSWTVVSVTRLTTLLQGTGFKRHKGFFICPSIPNCTFSLFDHFSKRFFVPKGLAPLKYSWKFLFSIFGRERM